MSKSHLYTVVCTAITAIYFVRADTATQTQILWYWVFITFAFTLWQIVAQFNYHRYMAKAPQREAEARARTNAFVEEHIARQSKPFVWEDWDGPGMVGGQRIG